jgi:hypothetical protein
MSVVDSLEVKIEATSKGADAQIDKLIAKMGELAKELNMIDASKFQDLATIMKSFAHIMISTKNNASAVNKAFDDMGNVGNVTKKAENSIKDLDKVVKDFSKTDFGYLKIPSTFFEQTKMLEKAENQLENLLSTEKKYIAVGTDTGSTKWANLQFDIAETKARIDKLTEATNNYKDAMSSNFDNFKIEAPKIPISDMIKHEIDNNASTTFEEFGICANSVIDSLKNNATDLNLKFSDLAKLNIADSFKEIKIDDNMPNDVQLMVEQYSKLKERLIEFEGIFNEMADDSRHFTDTSNGFTPFNRASESLEKIMEISREMKGLENGIDLANKKVDRLEQKFELEIAHDSLDELKAKLSDLTSKYKELEKIYLTKPNTEIGGTGKYSSDEIQQALIESDKYGKQINVLKNRIAELEKTNNSSMNNVASSTEKGFRRMKTAIKEATGNIASFNADINGVKVRTPLGNIASDIAFVLNKTGAILKNNPLTVAVTSAFGKIKEVASTKLGAFKEAIKTNLSEAKEVLSNTKFGAIVSGICTAFKTLGKVVGVAIKGAIATVKGLVTGLKAVSKVAKVVSAPLKAMTKMSMAPLVVGAKKLGGVFSGLGKQIKRVAKMYSLMLIRMALRKVIDNAKNSLNDLTRQNASVNESVSSIVSNFKYLGASITGAFSPIFRVVAPILDALVEKCVSVINTIGQVFASLTGAKTYTFAKKVQTDYAGSLEDTKKATDDAKKSAKEYENQLLGFDEITKLSAPTDNNSSGSSGSGADSVGNGYVFDTATIDNQYNNWADKLKEAWNNGDFTEIGEIVGRKLTDALDNINWDGIKEKCNRIASSVATFLNGFMEGADFTVIGKTIAEVFNTALETGYTFLATFNFNKFGEKIADLLNGAFDTIDWNLIANTVTESMKNTFDAILSFSENFHWGENATKIANAFKQLFDGLDFETVTKSLKEFGGGLSEALNEIFYMDDKRSLGSDLSKAVWDAFNSLIEGINTFIKDTDWAKISANLSQAIFGVITDVDWKELGNTISNIASSGFNALQGLFDGVDWDEIGQNLIKAIVDLFKGIDWGQLLIDACNFAVSLGKAGLDLIAGLLKGIGDALVGIGSWMKDNIFKPIFNGIKELFGIHSPSTVFAEIGGYLIAGLKEGISNAINTIGNWLNDNVVKPILKGVSAVKELVVTVKGKIEEGFQKAKDGWNTMKEGTKELLVKAKGLVEKGFNTTKSAWSGIKAGTKDLSLKAKATGQNIIDKFKKTWDSLKTKTITLGLKVNQLVGDVKGFINKQLIDKINSKLPKVFPKIPRLATGGMVDAGQLFIAREKGPEMVGTMGGKTTVANNQQIVEGISSGVYNAVVSAMAQFGGNRSNVNVVLEGDAKGLFRVVQSEGKTYQMSTGLPVF